MNLVSVVHMLDYKNLISNKNQVIIVKRQYNIILGTKYSRMDQVEFMEDSL